MIKTKRRFPNFICDGLPLGPPGDPAYYDEFETTEDFYNLEWVKEKRAAAWFQTTPDEYTGRVGIMAVYDDNPDGFGTYLCHAFLEEGELDMDTIDLSEEGIYAKVMGKYKLEPDPRYL